MGRTRIPHLFTLSCHPQQHAVAHCWRRTRLWSSLACLKPHHHQRTEDAGASGRIRRRMRTRRLDGKERRDTEKDDLRKWTLLTSLASRDSLLWGPPRKAVSARITQLITLCWGGGKRQEQPEVAKWRHVQATEKGGGRHAGERLEGAVGPSGRGSQMDMRAAPATPRGQGVGTGCWVWRLVGAKGQQGWGCLASSPRSICEAQRCSEVRVSPAKHWKRPWVPGRLLGGPSSSLPPASAHLALLLAPLQTYWHRTRLEPVEKQWGRSTVRDERGAWSGGSPSNRTRPAPAAWPGPPAPLQAGPLNQGFPCLLSNSEDIIVYLLLCYTCSFQSVGVAYSTRAFSFFFF